MHRSLRWRPNAPTLDFGVVDEGVSRHTSTAADPGSRCRGRHDFMPAGFKVSTVAQRRTLHLWQIWLIITINTVIIDIWIVLTEGRSQISTAGSAVYGIRKINQSICDLSRDGKLRRTGA
jgi:hypothetical protein